MGSDIRTPGVASGRLDAKAIADNFSDLHPPLGGHEAMVAADRCYFCYDAPCVSACPTTIDIPLFIRQIGTGTPEAAARTIFDQNILGGMCARVCPTEDLCEQACVREASEGKPVEIGRLQRFATDRLMGEDDHPYVREASSGKKAAVVGAGPAGLACAHRLAMKGHDVEIFEAKEKGGGLNEYGIAAYKTVNDFAQEELSWLLGIGGITVRYGQGLGKEVSLAELTAGYDAVFLGIGMDGVNQLGVRGADRPGVEDAVRFIADLRQSEDKTDIPVGRKVVVIGGGMTAVDAAVQSRLLGAEDVTIAYRRGREAMSASGYEQELASSKGVRILCNLQPREIDRRNGGVRVAFAYTDTASGRIEGSEESLTMEADQVLKAIGQRIEGVPEELAIDNGKISVDPHGRTSIRGVWAGGDCVADGDDLTVTAVAQGRDAAEDMHATLLG